MRSETVQISIPVDLVLKLAKRRNFPNECFGELIESLLDQAVQHSEHKTPQPTAKVCDSGSDARYHATVLGAQLGTKTLTEALSFILNALGDIDPNSLLKISTLTGRYRHHISNSPRTIYPGRPDLSQKYVQEFRPGWWVGTNYSFRDVRRILSDISDCLDLENDVDIRLERVSRNA